MFNELKDMHACSLLQYVSYRKRLLLLQNSCFILFFPVAIFTIHVDVQPHDDV